MKYTTHFEDLKEISDIKTIVPFLKKNNVEFKQKEMVKGSNIDLIIIDNEELMKISKGVDYGKGKHKLYYPKTIIENINLIILYNYFGWQGNFEPYSTTNHITLFKNKIKIKNSQVPNSFKNLIDLDSDSNSIGNFEKEIKKIYKIKITEQKKYLNIEEFIKLNPKLFNKYFSLIFNEKSIFININFIFE